MSRLIDSPEWAIPPENADSGLAYLECIKSNVLLEKIPLNKKSFYVLGRSEPLVDITLQHSSISRQHAIIGHHRTGSLVIVDLGTGNGTFLGTTRIPSYTPTVLKEGIAITFGASTRIYVVNGTGERKQQLLLEREKQKQRMRELEKILKEPEPDMDATLAQTDLNSSLVNPNNDCEAPKTKKNLTRHVHFSDNIVEHIIQHDKEEELEMESLETTAIEREGTFLKRGHEETEIETATDSKEEAQSNATNIAPQPDNELPKVVTKKRKIQPPPPPQQRAKNLQLLKALSKTHQDGLYDSIPPSSLEKSDKTEKSELEKPEKCDQVIDSSGDTETNSKEKEEKTEETKCQESRLEDKYDGAKIQEENRGDCNTRQGDDIFDIG